MALVQVLNGDALEVLLVAGELLEPAARCVSHELPPNRMILRAQRIRKESPTLEEAPPCPAGSRAALACHTDAQ